MKITSVEMHPINSNQGVVLSFQDLYRENPYNIKAIVGLDADSITSRYYGTATNSKTNFYDLSLEKRELIFKINLNPKFYLNESFSDLRDSLYKMIASSRNGRIQIAFKDVGETVAVITGFISKFEASHFEKTPEAQLTVNCDEPMLKAPNPVILPVQGLGFTRVDIRDDKSTAPHGFKFELGVTANFFTGITITDPDDLSWFFTMTLAWGLLTGDTIFFSTDYNDKQLYVVRGTTTYQIADWITTGSQWPVIFPGNNTFSFTQGPNLAWHSLSYFPSYWGI